MFGRVSLAVLALWLLTTPAFARPGGPKTFNLYIRNYFQPGDEDSLARWDALGLDVDTPPATLAAIRAKNPQIKLLAYIPINGTYETAPLFPATSKWREMYEAAETNDWWLRNTQGGHVYDHPGKFTINLTSACPVNGQGETVLEWYPRFIVQSVLANGGNDWDGVVLDDVWMNIWFVNSNPALNADPIDADQDGVAEDQPTLDGMWRAANDSVTARIMRTLPPGKVLIGNGGNTFYHMNGAIIENFPYRGNLDPGSPLGYSWTDKMFGSYGYFHNEDSYSGTPDRLNVNLAEWTSGSRYSPTRSPEFERYKRFCLVSTMLRDGYFALDWDQTTVGHHSLWWEPEYDKQIGTPTGAPYQVNYGGWTLWRRDYTNGSVLLNPAYSTFPGSTTSGIPPIGWLDARILLTGEFWAPESTPPAAIGTLAVTRTWSDHLEVQWTNVGDDGTSGQAVEVQVRYSTSPITGANWNSASLVPGPIVPELPGIAQTTMINSLTQNTTYYVAVKTRDLAGNWSDLSNVVSGTTVISDLTPPAAITDLTVVSTTSTGATVRWTVTGDDGTSGQATSVDLRYATFPLNAGNFYSGAAVVGEPTPGPSGTVHQMDLYGMTPYTTYYFAIKVGDEMPNWSTISNLPSAATQAGDVTPPAGVTDLHVTAVGSNWVTLEWTAPGDDGHTGRATSYDMRYSPLVLTAGNFTSANFVIGEPGPANAGTLQSMTISGLGVGYTYWFGIRTADEFPNWSVPSNIVTATTNPGDVTAPAAVTSLAITGSTASSLSLSWTAPGDDGSTGTAATYDIRYSTAAINAGNFGAATPLASPPLPAAAGTTQTATITGLTAGTTWYVALKTGDETPNWSAISNVPSGATTPAADVTPPAAISDLAVTASTSSSITLLWTAPGDDGAGGQATGYDLRYSTAAITAGNFASATAVTGEPAPTAPGTSQSMTVTGLTAGTTWWFAIKTADEVPNWSVMSNVPSGATPAAPDVTPPAAVANLAVTGSTANSISLSWTAPGDDNATGTAANYDLRYSTAAITAGNFASATAVTGEPAPAIAGTTQTMTVSGLTAGTTYYFALKTADEVPNWSPISNVPNGATQPPPDTTPPAAIANLAVTGSTTGSIGLSWTSPGDDNAAGTATTYDLRYSTAAITTGNFASATAVTGEPAPAAAGATQTMTVTGLNAGATYWFALKTADEVPNWSPISNVPSGATAAAGDVTPPATIANLAVTGSTTTSISLAWTSPGDDNATGTASNYDLRYATSPITPVNFSAATPATGEPSPATAGTSQAMTVNGLSPGTTWYFAIRAADEVPNWGSISNVPTGATLPAPDTTPPAAIANLAVTGSTATSISLSWTSPGDDNATGIATAYDLRYSTGAITAGNFESATAAVGEPAPAAAGATQTMTVTGLTAGTTYSFAIRTADEVPNWSALSNVPGGSTAPPPDTTPPAAIANLTVTGSTITSVSLSWTTPGDDNATGTAAGYDLRYSNAPITAGNFASAIQAAGLPAPAAPGTTQSMTVTGLNAGTTWWFAIKTADEVPNWSALSNVPTGATLPAPDTTPPAAITNLTVTGTTVSSASLSWTAPGDDNASGTASAYDLRYSTSVITAANFNAATPAAGEPTPGAAGATQTMTVSGLTAGTTWWFAIKTADEVPNWSGVSNVPTGATPPLPDTTPPAAVTGLTVTGSTVNTISLSWTSPGDDNVTGTATSYDLRYSTSIITAANFGSATPAVGEPAPAGAGATQTMSVSGLAAGTTYFFALKTADEVPNWSPLSNVPTGATLPLPDTTPPASITNLVVTGVTPNSVTLSWTAPGDNGTAGTATTYDLRYATSTISSGTWDAASPAAGEPVPAGAGTTQSMTVTGLAAGTTMWFAIRTADEVPNWSPLSNVPMATTLVPPDVTPPAAVSDLAVAGSSVNSITLTWTAPGDDGATGTASGYDLRYSTGPITEAGFAAATPAVGEPAPGPAGSPQSMTVTGLDAGTTWWFAVRASDEVPNWSAVSGPASGATQPAPDVTPPAAVTDLSITGSGVNSLTVTWSAPGDDGSSGSATACDLRYSTSPISEADFASATPVTGEPVPAAPGTTQSMSVTGLQADRTYWFALRVSDEVPNWSALSNVASGATLAAPDLTPPAAITGLTITVLSPTSLRLDWTAPGDDGQQGRAAQYDIRYDTAPITVAGFSSATAVTPAPAPGLPGSSESITITGLVPTTTVHAAIRTADEAGNWSTISNVPAATLPEPPDTTPPAEVTLTAIDSDTASATLGWLAPGDDGAAGSATSYDLRYALAPITAESFGTAGPVAGEPAPAPAGTAQSMTVTGLEPGTSYWFALVAIDDAGNRSPVSASIEIRTDDRKAPPETTPPLAPTGLSLIRTGYGVLVAWSPNVEPDLAGYFVYRRMNDGLWLAQNLDPSPGTTWADTVSFRSGLLEYRITAINTHGNEGPASESAQIQITDPGPINQLLQMSPPAPNPFATKTAVSLAVPSGGVASLLVFVCDVTGRSLRTLHAGPADGGSLDFEWDGRDQDGNEMPTGVYFLLAQTARGLLTTKIVRTR